MIFCTKSQPFPRLRVLPGSNRFGAQVANNSREKYNQGGYGKLAGSANFLFRVVCCFWCRRCRFPAAIAPAASSCEQNRPFAPLDDGIHFDIEWIHGWEAATGSVSLRIYGVRSSPFESLFASAPRRTFQRVLCDRRSRAACSCWPALLPNPSVRETDARCMG